jgi:tRNA modification GTPase
LDTAGIRQSGDTVEQMGVARAKNAIAEAEIILFVINGSVPLGAQDTAVMELLDAKKPLCLVNKSDLPQKSLALPDFVKTISVSAVSGQGLDTLFAYIEQRFSTGALIQHAVVTNPRHRDSLLAASRLLDAVLAAMAGAAPFDILLGDLELTVAALGEISGMTVSDEIVENIFANFCVGK